MQALSLSLEPGGWSLRLHRVSLGRAFRHVGVMSLHLEGTALPQFRI